MDRKSAYRVNLKLNPEYDHDLIEWIEGLERGKRSEEIRQALRAGIGLLPSPDAERELIANIIREAISDALAGIQIIATQQGAAIDVNELEEAFGAQLDNLLGSFGDKTSVR